jgi:hypothetical protein
VQLRLRRRNVQRAEVALAHARFVMRLVRSCRAESDEVDVAFEEEEIHPVADGLLDATGWTAVQHLDAVIVADEEMIFHIVPSEP